MNLTMTRKCLVPAAFLGVMLTASVAQADPQRSINARQAQQRERLQQGSRSGELTYAERQRLQARQAQTRRQEARYRQSGGKLTLAERLRLERELKKDSKAIRNNKNDRRDNDWRSNNGRYNDRWDNDRRNRQWSRPR